LISDFLKEEGQTFETNSNVNNGFWCSSIEIYFSTKITDEKPKKIFEN